MRYCQLQSRPEGKNLPYTSISHTASNNPPQCHTNHNKCARPKHPPTCPHLPMVPSRIPRGILRASLWAGQQHSQGTHQLQPYVERALCTLSTTATSIPSIPLQHHCHNEQVSLAGIYYWHCKVHKEHHHGYEQRWGMPNHAESGHGHNHCTASPHSTSDPIQGPFKHSGETKLEIIYLNDVVSQKATAG